MFHLHLTLLLLSMGVFSHMTESGMPRDTTVDLATVLNRVNMLEARLHSTMSALQTNIDDVAATKTELQATKTELQTTKTELQTTMDDLTATKTELQSTKARLQDQEQHSSSMNRTLNTIMAQLQKAKSRLQEQKGYSSSMNSSLNVLQQQQKHCSSSLNALKTELASKTNNVAFSVYLTKGAHYAHFVSVKFDGVQYNAGNGYRTSTGKFTAPVSGTYIFSTELDVGNSSLTTFIRILHSGTVVSSGWGLLNPDNHGLTIPVTEIIHVREGEQVWVDSETYVYLYSGRLSSHFVGALLSPD